MNVAKKLTGSYDFLDGLAERVDLLECRVDVRSYANALEFRVDDRNDDDAMFLFERRLGERIERFRGAVLTPLQQRSAATLAAYRSNQASLVMLFEARHAELEAGRKLLSLQRDLARIRVQLVYKSIHGAAQ